MRTAQRSGIQGDSAMMERPTGPPLGAATQSTGRPLIDDSGIPRPAPLNTVRRIVPNSNIPPTIPNLSAPADISDTDGPLSGSQVVALVQEAMKHALEENQTKAAEASGVSNELKPGVTIDLSHKQIQKFPEEVVDIIKNDLERLALSHNQIYSFPSRLSECTSLRYLNVRSNVIRDFPLAICDLTSLEILDLGRNMLKVLPPELVKLTSLKVLSVQKNRIEDLPLCLADMISLQVLKIKGNPIRFPPKEILQPEESNSPHTGFQEGEMDEVAVTSQIKRFLRQKAISDRSETESGGEESSEGAETPRPVKRVMSGRFPIKVNGSEVPDLRSPALPRPPPIPSRSHYRGLSQQTATIRRPGVMPLTIGNANERLRSNSENLASARSTQDRSRRMGIVSRKPSDLGTVDESKLNRYSHYRGLSHGSAMGGTNGTNGSITSRSPASPADSTALRATYVRRLSSLPERKRKSSSPDPIIEGAQGILFALFQVHPLIQNLLGLARDGTNKRTSLERVFYNATTHVEELDRHLQHYITYSEEDEELSPRTNENVLRACSACVSAYIHICSLLSGNAEALLANGDPRYIRHLLLLVYGSLVEVRNAGSDLFVDGVSDMMSDMRISRISEESEDTIRGHTRDKSVTPTRDRPSTNVRLRSTTVVQHSNNFRLATDPTPQLHSGPRYANVDSAAPRSGDSFTSYIPSSTRPGMDFTEEDRLFEKIFLQLQKSSDMAIRNLPIVYNHFHEGMKINGQMSKPETTIQFWHVLIQRNGASLQKAEALKHSLSLIVLKDPGIRSQGAFWDLCRSFIRTYAALAESVKDAKAVTTLLPWVDVIGLLRPLQKEVKLCSQLIQQSPWSSNPTNGTYGVQSPVGQMPLPMTPQSAALGPAVQATVPSTPNTSYNAMFSGNVFERADALLSSNAGSSRAGTMTSGMGGPSDGMGLPSSSISPLKSVRPRFNSNGKISL